jgi:predicted RNA polymerase sigma factor
MHLASAAEGNDLSEYHLQAGIAAIHCTASDFASTDWTRILRHYDALQRIKPSPIVELNRAIAVAQLQGAQAGLDALACIADRKKIESYHLFHAAQGELHWRLGDERRPRSAFDAPCPLLRSDPSRPTSREGFRAPRRIRRHPREAFRTWTGPAARVTRDSRADNHLIKLRLDFEIRRFAISC